jgi:demethylmenaquinone methyltransferase / 2-methoxy-6-polyprenyl-1,4-benzoquinol methylase
LRRVWGQRFAPWRSLPDPQDWRLNTKPISNAQRPHDSLISASENRAMFDHIANWYDSTNRLLSLGFDVYWRREAVNALAPLEGGLYLDVGCGTADVSIEIVRRQRRCRVIGVDPSEGMLAVGRAKIARAGETKRGAACCAPTRVGRGDASVGQAAITLLRGDALNLQFPAGIFDGLITSFCVRNITDRRAALKEFRRVLKPGGRLVVLELTHPSGPIMGPLFRIYSHLVMPAVTKVMSSAPSYKYLVDSMADFSPPERFRLMTEQAGFENARFRTMTGGITALFTGIAP